MRGALASSRGTRARHPAMRSSRRSVARCCARTPGSIRCRSSRLPCAVARMGDTPEGRRISSPSRAGSLRNRPRRARNADRDVARRLAAGKACTRTQADLLLAREGLRSPSSKEPHRYSNLRILRGPYNVSRDGRLRRAAGLLACIGPFIDYARSGSCSSREKNPEPVRVEGTGVLPSGRSPCAAGSARRRLGVLATVAAGIDFLLYTLYDKDEWPILTPKQRKLKATINTELESSMRMKNR